MRFKHIKASLKTTVSVATVLLLGAGMALAQGVVNLTAAPTTLSLPDGTSVPMWGYSCNDAGTAGATCAASNKGATTWSPVLITAVTGSTLTINLTNNLPKTSDQPTGLPTSLMIVGQVGGGLGNPPATTQSPTHSDLTVTWPTAGAPGSFIPPPQPDRVRSFGTEIVGGTTST